MSKTTNVSGHNGSVLNCPFFLSKTSNLMYVVALIGFRLAWFVYGENYLNPPKAIYNSPAARYARGTYTIMKSFLFIFAFTEWIAKMVT